MCTALAAPDREPPHTSTLLVPYATTTTMPPAQPAPTTFTLRLTAGRIITKG